MKKYNQASLEGSLYSKVARQICRYHPHDERPAPSRDMTIGGPMLRLAIEHGIRGWLFVYSWHGAPVSMETIADLVSAGAFDNCIAYVDFKITDDDASDERFCLWKLCGGGHPIEFLSPIYAKLQGLRSEEIERNKIAKSARKATNPPKTLKTRTDTL